MSIKMPKEVTVQCEECGVVDTAYWGQYGAEAPCFVCSAAPIHLEKVDA